MVGDLLAVTGGAALLYLGGELLVRGASGLALGVGLSPLFVGLTVVAFGTSSPELIVSLRAALEGLGDVSVGNVVGSNICNVGLILGLSAMVRPLHTTSQLVRLDIPIMIGCSLALFGLLHGDELGRMEGGALVAALAVYTGVTFRVSRVEGATGQEDWTRAVRPGRSSRARELSLVAAGLGLLVLGGTWFVDGAVALAEGIGVSEAVIGLTVVAVGTSLPELATSIIAAMRREPDIAIGNIVGSNIFNILGVLGLSSLVRPVTPRLETADVGMMMAMAVVLLPLVRSKFELARWEGALLFAGYVAYTVWLLGR